MRQRNSVINQAARSVAHKEDENMTGRGEDDKVSRPVHLLSMYCFMIINLAMIAVICMPVEAYSGKVVACVHQQKTTRTGELWRTEGGESEGKSISTSQSQYFQCEHI